MEALTGEVRHVLELLRPVLGDLDGLVLHLLAVCGVALLVGVCQDLGQVLRVDRVEHIEEIVARWPLALRIFVGEEAHHVRVLQELRVEVLHGELLEVGHLHVHLLRLQEELLLVLQEQPQEILVDDRLVWDVELFAVERVEKWLEFKQLVLLEVIRHAGYLLFVEIVEEVLLRFELVVVLRCHHPDDRTLLRLGGLVLLHLLVIRNNCKTRRREIKVIPLCAQFRIIVHDIVSFLPLIGQKCQDGVVANYAGEVKWRVKTNKLIFRLNESNITDSGSLLKVQKIKFKISEHNVKIKNSS